MKGLDQAGAAVAVILLGIFVDLSFALDSHIL
jgi:hypothetical protein